MAINKLWQIGMNRIMGAQATKVSRRISSIPAFARGLTFVWFAFTLFWSGLETDRSRSVRIAERCAMAWRWLDQLDCRCRNSRFLEWLRSILIH